MLNFLLSVYPTLIGEMFNFLDSDYWKMHLHVITIESRHFYLRPLPQGKLASRLSSSFSPQAERITYPQAQRSFENLFLPPAERGVGNYEYTELKKK